MSALFPLAWAGELPQVFWDPFADGPPHPVAQAAANHVKGALARDGLCKGEGKMFGVLVVRAQNGQLGYLKAFSGMLNGRWEVEGFVPPAFDMPLRLGFEGPGAQQVQRLQEQCQTLKNDSQWLHLQQEERDQIAHHTQVAQAMAQRHRDNRSARKQKREAVLQLLSDTERNAGLHALAQESRADKAEQRQAELTHQTCLYALQDRQKAFALRHRASVRLLHMVCRRLMRRIHDCYVLRNAAGEASTLRNLFAPGEPPSGAADCAAPKLLAYAHAQGLLPLALAEFWWGPAPATGGRVAGAFYPACKGKCGPLLPFMLRGLAVGAPSLSQVGHQRAIDIVYEDSFVVVVNKPAGLLSVPGRGADRQDCVLAQLQYCLPNTQSVWMVHRLDQDTSGLLLAAKSQASYVMLQRQFTARRVHKRYVACVDGLVAADEGSINLPLRLDVNERPRQVVDSVFGKPALTQWKVLRKDGGHPGRTWLHLFPRSGRTHQLRVHCSHPDGLNAPIVGDRLYGSPGARLCLHAEELGFVHPMSGAWMVFKAPADF